MKTKTHNLFILATCLLTLNVSSCSMSKSYDAPELESIYQNKDGIVFAKIKDKKSSSHPQFSFDGKEWYGTQSDNQDEKNNFQLQMHFDIKENKFYVTKDTENIFFEGGEKTFYIREQGDQSKGASAASNSITYTIKYPNNLTLTLENEKAFLNSSYTHPGTTETDDQLKSLEMAQCIVYDASTQKYAFAKKVYKGNKVFEYQPNNEIASKLEYCFINPNDYQGSQDIISAIEDKAYQGQISFKDCSNEFSLDGATLTKVTQPGSNDQNATAVFRYKGSDKTLPSKLTKVEVLKEETKVTCNPNPQGGHIDTGSTYDSSTKRFNIKITMSDHLEMSDLHDHLFSNVTSNYFNSLSGTYSYSIRVFDPTNENEEVTNNLDTLDQGHTYTLKVYAFNKEIGSFSMEPNYQS